MKVYPSELVWNEKLASIPKAQRERQFRDMDRLFHSQGFKVVGQGEDRHGHYAEVAIRPGTSMQAVNQFLEDYAVSALTVRPEDVEPIYGKSIVTLGMKRKLEYDGDSDVAMLQPDELVTALDRLRVSSQFGGPVSEEIEDFIEMDLQNEGYLSQSDVDQHNAWMNPPAPQPAIPFDGGEDWNPDTSVDEWADQ